MSTTEKEPEIEKEELKEKKKQWNKKKTIIYTVLVILIGYVLFEFYSIRLIHAKNWTTEEADCLRMDEGGNISFYNAGAGSSIDSFDLLPKYFYLTRWNIIAYGNGMTARLCIPYISKDKLIMYYGGKKYVFYEEVEDIALEDMEDVIYADEIGFFTCNECHTFMYEKRADYYVSSSIDKENIGAYKTKDKISKAQKVKSDKDKKLPLAKDVKYYSINISTSTTSMEEIKHSCQYKELNYSEVEKLYNGEPKYAYIWLNKEKEAEIILYVNLEVIEVPDEEVSDEVIRNYIENNEKLNMMDFKNILEIAK